MQASDLDAFHGYRSDPVVARFQGYDSMTKDDAAKFIEKQIDRPFGEPGQWVQYAITLRTNDVLLGDCAIRLDADDTRIASIGITIAPSFQQHGYATEVVAGIMHFLFTEQACHRIVETVIEGNTASISLLEDLGFRREGHFIEDYFSKGKWVNEFQYALLKREWEIQTHEK